MGQRETASGATAQRQVFPWCLDAEVSESWQPKGCAYMCIYTYLYKTMCVYANVLAIKYTHTHTHTHTHTQVSELVE